MSEQKQTPVQGHQILLPINPFAHYIYVCIFVWVDFFTNTEYTV